MVRLSATVATVLVLVQAAVCSAAATPSRLSFEWSVPDNLRDPNVGVARDAAGATVAPTMVRLLVLAGGACGNLQWEVDGHAAHPTPEGGCTFDLDLGDHGQHEITLRHGDASFSDKVSATDFLVVSIGDSVASGEGNPSSPNPVVPDWLEPRCHRSLRSGAAEAALALERADRHSEISLLALACSGATVTTGLLGPYAGIQPDARLGDLPAQMKVVSALQPHQIDALLVSVGANDVNFGSLVEFCLRFDRCPSQPFDPRAPLHLGKPPAQSAAAVEKAALARLPAEYDTLAAALDQAKVDPKRVIIVEYFDPLRDATGSPCGHALIGIDQTEAAWAEANVLAPLNAEVRAAAERHGWRVVTGVADAFATHGICVAGDGRWIRGPVESLGRGAWISGTLHPNGRGHRATAALIEPVLANTLGVADEIGSGEVAGTSDDEGWRLSGWWVVAAAVAGLGVGFGVGFLVLRSRAGR